MTMPAGLRMQHRRDLVNVDLPDPFTDQAMHLARPQGQVDVAQRDYAAEMLGDRVDVEKIGQVGESMTSAPTRELAVPIASEERLARTSFPPLRGPRR
jgi:hypothetical protein